MNAVFRSVAGRRKSFDATGATVRKGTRRHLCFSCLRSLLLRQGSTTSLAGFFGSASIREMQGFLHSRWSVEMTILW